MAKSIQHNVFPDLSPRAELFEKTGLIEKSWLDSASMAFPEHLSSLNRSIHFFRIKGIPVDFDDKNHRLKPITFDSSLFAAIYNQSFPIVYLIECKKGHIRVFLGTNDAGKPALSALLTAGIGPALCDKNPVVTQFESTEKSCCAALTGIPGRPEPDGRFGRDTITHYSEIDSLITGMMNEEWTYVVQAFPIRRGQTNLWLESCAREIKDTKESFLLRDMQKSNRMASYYVEILEKSIRRLKWGVAQGLWQTGVYLLSNQAETVSRGVAILTSIFSGDKSGPEPIRSHICIRPGTVSPFINYYHSKEIQQFISFPEREFPGYRLRERVLFDVDFHDERPKPLQIGRIMADDRVLDHPATVPVDDLTRHALVAGVTGSGKTNTIFNLLRELYLSYHVPFLVIEPAKSEYRNLFKEIESLLVFTLGEERPGVSFPFRLNPFSFPEGIPLQTHIDYLKAVFDASFVMYAPMPYVLEECLYKVYQDKGWNLVTSTNFRGKGEASFPTLTDLYLKIDEVVENIGYQDRTTMDIKAALKTRINNLCLGGKGMMLNTTSSIPFDEIMARPTVLELKYLGNDEEKAFMMGLILTAVWEHYEAVQGRQNITNRGLNHLTVIEEAHRLLKNVPTEKTSEEMSNIKGKGVETFCNLLAEIRAYGEGVLVSEQIPAKLAPDVIKNSNLKIMHRIVAREDRELTGDAMNLDNHQKRNVVSLEVGEAVFFREGLDRPLRVRIPLCSLTGEELFVSDYTIHKGMGERFYSRNPNLLIKFTACHDCLHKSAEECERVKRDVEERRSGPGWQETGVRLFIPYLIDPDRGGFMEHLRSVVDIPEDALHCFMAHLIADYVKAKGDYLNWPFAQVAVLTSDAQQAIETEDFARVIGSYCRKHRSTSTGIHVVCDTYCRQKCLFSYEGRVLARDSVIHNRLVDVLNLPEYGVRFYQELVILIVDFVRDYLAPEQGRDIGDMAVCYLIQKFNELSFSLSLQRGILKEFVNVLNP